MRITAFVRRPSVNALVLIAFLLAVSGCSQEQLDDPQSLQHQLFYGTQLALVLLLGLAIVAGALLLESEYGSDSGEPVPEGTHVYALVPHPNEPAFEFPPRAQLVRTIDVDGRLLGDFVVDSAALAAGEGALDLSRFKLACAMDAEAFQDAIGAGALRALAAFDSRPIIADVAVAKGETRTVRIESIAVGEPGESAPAGPCRLVQIAPGRFCKVSVETLDRADLLRITIAPVN